MNQIKRLTKEQLINLGGSGYTKRDLVNNVERLYTSLKATDLEDLRTKSINFIPRIKLIPETKTKLKKAIKQKYEITRLKNRDLANLTQRYKNDLQKDNFEEIVRIAQLHDGFLKYNRNGQEVIYRVNERYLLTLRRLLTGVVDLELEQNSDTEFLIEIKDNIENIIGHNVIGENFAFINEDEVRYQNQTGGFLLKGHILPFDFSRYGLFNKDQNIKEYHKNNCLYHAFSNGGMSKVKLDSLKIDFFQRDISIKNLTNIAEKLDVKIVLRICNDVNGKKITYGTNDNEVYNINIIEGHFFIQEDTEYTSFVLENYEIVKDEKNFMNIVGISSDNKFTRKNNVTINSKRLMEIVINKYSYIINKMDVINTVYHSKIKSRTTDLEHLNTAIRMYKTQEEKEIINNINKQIKKYGLEEKLRSIDQHQKENKKLETVEKIKRKSNILRVFFDFETVASDTNTSLRKDPLKNEEFEHKPRELTYIIGENSFYYSGYDCGRKFIDHILKIKDHTEIHLIAHNAGFDFNFIASYLPNLEICKIESRFIYALCYGPNSKIYVKDSWAFIASPLSKFSKIFKLEDHKLEFDHSWIKYEDLDENGILINNFINSTEKTPKEIINENGQFDVNEYSRYYNLLDVKVLQQGYNKFAEWAEQLDTNIDQVYTISSLAKVYASKQGCFDGCYELSGIPQSFISQAIMGGRVMTQENKMILKENCKVATLDANSLYPSAMINIDGFLKGCPKVIIPENLNLEFLNKQDYYYVDILIKKVGKYLKMPLLAIRNETSINYTNDCEGQILTVGKIYLEDLIKFQKIEYEIIRGYYFNDGFNNRIKEVVNHLYNTRNKLKFENNPAEAMYKLILNSIYGKCLQKPRDKKLVVKNSRKEMLKYIVRNKTNIEMVEKLSNCDKWLIREYKEINDDFNFVHIGGHILDQSKRIMNEVITLAEDNDIDIYYTDTDSMHLDLENIKKLENEYKKIYKKELINNELLGFKQDFGKDNKGNELYATRCVFLGKKTYIDVLSDEHSHCRAKGITQKALEYESKRQNKSLFEIYKERYNGKTQVFDLTCGGEAFTAKQKNNYTFVSINNFTRTF